MSRSVTTPDGEMWRVGRRWVPGRTLRWHTPRPLIRRRTGRQKDRRDRDVGWADGLQILDAENPFAALVYLVGVVLVAALVWFFVVPLLLLLTDALILFVLAGAGIVARVVLRRPWEIEAVGPTGRLSWRVSGWRRSRKVMAEISEWLARGEVPPADSPTFPSR